jgi:hypothetical protein
MLTSIKHRLPPAPWDIVKLDAPALMEPLAGRFAIQTDPNFKGHFITVVDGGGKITDVIHTDAYNPLSWEQFTFWVDSATEQLFAFQTETGNFITAVDAGGRTTDTIHSDATIISTWETFKLVPQSAFPNFAIQTLRGFFLTAVGGGGHASGDTIHTDALEALEWERFTVLRRLDFGSASTYALWAWYNPKNPTTIDDGYLVATNGGGAGSEFVVGVGAPFQMSWTLLKQGDGTYAFQSASGKVVTANDGGLPGGGFAIDTPPDQIGNFEKFRIVDNGDGSDFTAIIKTFSGTYLAQEPNTKKMITVMNANQAQSFQFQLLKL